MTRGADQGAAGVADNVQGVGGVGHRHLVEDKFARSHSPVLAGHAVVPVAELALHPGQDAPVAVVENESPGPALDVATAEEQERLASRRHARSRAERLDLRG